MLGVALLVTVIGAGALLATRVAGKEAGTLTDWEEAGTLAQAAVEHAISNLNATVATSPATWRSGFTSYTSGASAAFTQSMGRGTWSWVVKDEVDGNFANNYVDPFRVYGIGKVGRATRVYSVRVVPGGSPLDVLRCGLHVAGNATINGPVNGTLISCNSQMNTGQPVYANVEAVQQSGSGGNCYGTLTTGSSVSKTMPSSGLYDVYLSKATAITYAATLTPKLLTSSTNPYGAANPEGVYSITVPGQNLQITGSRITGTLVISMTGGTLNITGPILWEPSRPDYPILIVKGSGVTVNITGSTTWLSEASLGVDLNGNGTTSDDLPPQYRGLINIIGSNNTVNVSGNAYVKGLLLVDGTVTTTGQSTYVADPSFQTRPPMGYGKGDQLAIVPGSWVWDSPP